MIFFATKIVMVSRCFSSLPQMMEMEGVDSSENYRKCRDEM